MTLEEFLVHTAENAVYPGANKAGLDEAAYLALGLAGETGEAVDIIKKLMRGDFKDVDPKEWQDKLALELGDVLWYWIRLVWFIGHSPESIMHLNYKKLKDRKAQKALDAKGLAPPFEPPKEPSK